jgi:type IV pilus assembly protein PilC
VGIKAKAKVLGKPPRLPATQLPPIPPQTLLQLAQLLGCGVPLLKAIELLQGPVQGYRQDRGQINKNLVKLKQELRNGLSLSAALVKHFALNPCYASLLVVGENTGNIETLLATIANYELQALALKNKVVKALTYPAIILIAVSISLVFMIAVVIPEFVKLYGEFNLALPKFTLAIISLAKIVQHYGWLVVLSFLVPGLYILWQYKRRQRIYQAVHRKLLTLPWLGLVVQKFILARCFAALSLCLKAGVPITTSLELMAAVTNNVTYKAAFAALTADLYVGMTLTTAITNYNRNHCLIFPAIAIEMLVVSEATGQLELMLQQIADIFAGDVNTIITRVVALLEPGLILIFGVVVGVIVVAMYLPLFNVGELL